MEDPAAVRAATDTLLRPPSAKAARTDGADARQQQRITELFSTVCEVLRHFWAALVGRDQVRSRMGGWRAGTVGRADRWITRPGVPGGGGGRAQADRAARLVVSLRSLKKQMQTDIVGIGTDGHGGREVRKTLLCAQRPGA